MLALGQPRCRASGFYCLIDDNGMTVCLDVFRVTVAAYRASICAHAFFRTRRLLGHAAFILVTVCRNLFLFYEYLAADGAMFALRQARLRAGGDNGGHCHGRMCGKFAIFFTTDCTLRPIGAGGGATAMRSLIHFDSAAGASLPVACAVGIPCVPRRMYDMTCSGLDHISADSAFNRAILARLFSVRNVRGNIILSAAHCANMPMMIGIRGPFVRIFMRSHCNYLLCNNYFIADGAFLSFSEPRGCTGGGNCRQCDGGVPRSLNYFLLNQNFTADGALLSFGQAVLRTGGSYGRNDFDFMTRGGNGLVCGIIASRAGDIVFPPALGAGGGLTCVLYIVVTERINGFRLGLAAAGTGIGHHAFLCACRRRSYRAVIPIVTQCLYRTALLLAAAGAGGNFLARLSTCRCGLYFVVGEIMTECGNYN